MAEQRTLRQMLGDVLRLMGAAGAGQVVALAAAPIITRLYDPTAFGKFAIATALITIYLPLASLRYEMALMLPRNDEDAVRLFVLCLWLVGLATLLLGMAAAVLLSFFGVVQLVLVPLVAAIMGTHAVVMGWLVRRRAIAQLGLVRFVTVAGVVAAQIALSPILGGFTGLLLGYVGGHVIGIAVASRRWHWHRAMARWRGVRREALWRVAQEYRGFGLFSAPTGAANSIGVELAKLAMPVLYGPAVAGQVNLAERVMGQPATLVGLAVNQVFWVDAAQLFVDDPERLSRLFWRLSLLLFAAMLPALVLTVYGGEIFAFVFGETWQQAGTFAGVLVIAQVVSLPTHATNGLHCYRFNRVMSAWDIGRLSMMALAFTLAWYLALSPLSCVMLFAATGGSANLILWSINMIVIRRAQGSVRESPVNRQEGRIAYLRAFSRWKLANLFSGRHEQVPPPFRERYGLKPSAREARWRFPGQPTA